MHSRLPATTAAHGRVIVAVAAMPLLASCNRVQNVLVPADRQATDIVSLWDTMLWMSMPAYVLVLVALLVAVRRNHGPVASDRTLHCGLLVWVVSVAVLLAALASTSLAIDRRLHAPIADPLRVRVTARQWWWQVEYPDPSSPSRNIVTANELHLPAGRPARIELRAGDVIHSLWIPSLAGKEDLIPGRENILVVAPRIPGRYRGQCAEFCGLQHAHMALDVLVEPPQTFAAWQARQRAPARTPRDASAMQGRRLFEQGDCALCHTIRGSSARGLGGPDLTHFASRHTLAAGTLPLDRITVAAWLLHPRRYKPGAHMLKAPLDAQQVDAISDYLTELR